ncbi:MAG TPA: hypothetical protein VMY39_02790 [Planctomycetota bacterium]|nr:hypothetical protein [Planctomycetota bacterium]
MKFGLEGIGPGDLIVVGHGPSMRALRVDRLTKTQVVVVRGTRYRIKDGEEVGVERTAWPRDTRARPATEDNLRWLRMRRARARVGTAVADPSLTLDQLEAILKICETKAEPVEVIK